jgi:hypothetical protein
MHCKQQIAKRYKPNQNGSYWIWIYKQKKTYNISSWENSFEILTENIQQKFFLKLNWKIVFLNAGWRILIFRLWCYFRLNI